MSQNADEYEALTATYCRFTIFQAPIRAHYQTKTNKISSHDRERKSFASMVRSAHRS